MKAARKKRLYKPAAAPAAGFIARAFGENPNALSIVK